MLGFEDEESAIDELKTAWDKVALALGEAPVSAAVRMANAFPVRFQPRRISPIYHRFLNVAYHLQLLRGEEYICLPVHKLAQILGVTPTRVSDYRNNAIQDRFLQLEAKACWNPKGEGSATKFRFIGWDLTRAPRA